MTDHVELIDEIEIEDEDNIEKKELFVIIDDDRKKSKRIKRKKSKNFCVTITLLFSFFAVFNIITICAIFCYEKFMRESTVGHMVIVIGIFEVIFVSYFLTNIYLVVFCKK